MLLQGAWRLVRRGGRSAELTAERSVMATLWPGSTSTTTELSEVSHPTLVSKVAP
jgi:hypothetical protein